MRSKATCLFVVSAALSGCLLLKDLDSLDGDDAGPAQDASDVPTDRSEPPPTEAGPKPEAGADAAPDAPPGPFCSTVSATFCDDYARTTPLGNWSALQQIAPATVTIEDEAAVVYSGVTDAGVAPYAYLSYAPAAEVAIMTWTADVTFDDFPVGPRNFAQFVLPDQAKYNTVTLVMANAANGLQVYSEEKTADGGTRLVQYQPTVKINPGQTTRVRFSLEQTARKQNAHLQLEIDGQVSVSVDLGSNEPLNLVELRQGITYVTPPAEPWSIRYDNTTIDVVPAAP